MFTVDELMIFENLTGPSLWSSGLRRRSAAGRLLGLRFRVLPWTWKSVYRECCVVARREMSATGRPLMQRCPTECCMRVSSSAFRGKNKHTE